MGELAFDPSFVIRGLVLDLELGNIVKPNRFGYVKRAYHGTAPLAYDEQRRAYARTIVDLAEPRWVFLNTFFSLSEGCMYAQLVDLLDRRLLPEVLGYAEPLRAGEARARPRRTWRARSRPRSSPTPSASSRLDPETPLALLDQRRAGKKLLLISNSEWVYTRAHHAATRSTASSPRGMTFRDLFDVLVVSARKPEFFTERAPLFEVVSDDGPAPAGPRPARGRRLPRRPRGAWWRATSALSGDEILYVGDHIYGDVKVSKSVLRWRTALIVRELEGEIAAEEADAPQRGAPRRR